MTNQEDLGTYLSTHLTGADGGLALARRMAREHKDSRYGKPLQDLAVQIAEDHDTLRELLNTLDVDRGLFLRLGSLGAVTTARLHPHGALVGHNELGLVLQLEMLGAGILGKRRLWEALLTVADDAPTLDAEELRMLAQRAEAQLDSVHRLHVDAAQAAFGGPRAG